MSARYAAQSAGRADAHLLTEIRGLRALFAAGNMRAFARYAGWIAAAYPLDTSYFEPLAATPLRLEAGQAIYGKYCLGCHVHPDPSALNPAPDLFAMAATMARVEFAARMLGGIHGDRTTALENPFSDEEIASLMVYFIHEGRARPQR